MTIAKEVLAGGKIRSGTKNARRYEFECVATQAIAAGDICYASDVTGHFWKATKADADSPVTANGILLIAKHRVTSGKRGRFAMIGTIDADVTGADVDTSASPVGSRVFLSGTAGGWSLTTTGVGRVVGTVLKSSATVGQIQFNGLINTPDQHGNPAASAAITGTTETLTAFDNSGVIIPANRLRVGTKIRVRASGIVTAASGAETHVLAIMLGGVAIMPTGNIDPAANDVFDVDAELIVRATGAGGTILGVGIVRSGPRATAAPASHLIATGSAGTSTQAVDTTGALTLAIGLDRQAAATDGDSMRLDWIRVEIVG